MREMKKKFFEEHSPETKKQVDKHSGSLNIADHWQIFAAATDIDPDDILMKMIFISGSVAATHITRIVTSIGDEDKMRESWKTMDDATKKEFAIQLIKTEELLHHMLKDRKEDERPPTTH